MRSNFLSLNPSKTELLLIGLPEQHAKLSQTSLILSDNTTSSATTSARNLGIVFDSALSFKQNICSRLSHAFITFVISGEFDRLWISTLLAPLQLHLCSL